MTSQSFWGIREVVAAAADHDLIHLTRSSASIMELKTSCVTFLDIFSSVTTTQFDFFDLGSLLFAQKTAQNYVASKEGVEKQD